MAPQTRTIGRFVGATLIGRGGFGAVYKADDAEHGRQVAIKVLPGTMGETERRRFDRERQTMGRLGSHPNIIPVHESGYTDDGEGYIVMELAPEGSLRSKIDDSGPLGWREAATISVAIAGAGQAAHDQGVLHRDIKPDNILIDGYGNPRLTDFGIAAVASNATATTSTTATLAHAAPELLDGQTSTVAVDIYAIGSTFYNLVLGHPPFLPEDDLGVTAMIGRALTQPPPDLRPHGVPDAVATVIERSMAKEASGRQRSASELADQLRAAIDNPGGTAVAPAPAEPPASATVVSPSPPVGPATVAAPAASVAPSGPVPHEAPPHLRPQPHQPDPAPYSVPGAAAEATIAASVPNPVSQPGPMAGAAAGAGIGAGAGGGPPATYSGQSPFAPNGGGGTNSGGGGRTPVLLAVGAIVIAVLAAGAVLALTGSDNSANPTPTTETTETTEESSTTESAETAEETTTTETEQTTESAEETTTSGSTTSASTSTSTTSTTVADSACPIPVFDGQTARFDVMICTNAIGSTSYVASNRDTGDGIDLPACFTGFESFLAENEGFTYEVNLQADVLYVTSPDGEIVVEEPFATPYFTDFDSDIALCS